MTSEPKIRLYVEDDLRIGDALTLSAPQSHYLNHVMRVRAGGHIALFNGRDGEWSAAVEQLGKKVVVRVERLLRAQTSGADIWLAFAPIKHGRVDYLVEKATELGASMLQPVLTRRTIATRLNLERLRAHTMEAAEQSDRLDVPLLREPVRFDALLQKWPPERRLLYGDETGGGKPVAEMLENLPKHGPLGLLTGPEGGFASEELEALRRHPAATAMSLGPRILRADTAALAALACVQALRGDWVAGLPHQAA